MLEKAAGATSQKDQNHQAMTTSATSICFHTPFLTSHIISTTSQPSTCNPTRPFPYHYNQRRPRVILTMTTPTNDNTNSNTPSQTPPNSSSSDDTSDSNPLSSDPTEAPENQKKPHEIPQSTIDWNAAWQNYKISGKQPMNKGREPAKQISKLERTVKQARQKFVLPPRAVLFKDWRFWLTVIVALSVFSAMVSQGSQALNGGGAGII